MSQLELSFVSQRDPGSLAIRWFTHSDFSHVDIIRGDRWRVGARSDCPNYPDGPYGVRAKCTGVVPRLGDYAVFSRDERVIISCTDLQYQQAWTWLRQQLGKPYDSTGLFRSFLFDDYNWRDEDKWWCSELAAVFIEKAGFSPIATPANRVSPNDAYIYAAAMPGARVEKVL